MRKRARVAAATTSARNPSAWMRQRSVSFPSLSIFSVVCHPQRRTFRVDEARLAECEEEALHRFEGRSGALRDNGGRQEDEEVRARGYDRAIVPEECPGGDACAGKRRNGASGSA
jgi:hypothetical protein